MTTTPKPLACPGRCGAQRRVGRLLCKDCWKRMPTPARYDLFACWRAAENNLSDDVLWARYMQARRAALATLR